MSESSGRMDSPDLDTLRTAYALDRARPCLRMNFVSSVDGAVEVNGHSRGLSSDADRRVYSVLRSLTDAVLVGAGTLRHEGYGPVRLTEQARAWRRYHGLAEYPTLVVVSESLHLDPGDTVFAEAPVRPVVLTHANADADRRSRLAPVADVIALGEDAVTDLAGCLAELHLRGLGQILCEGGPHLFGTLLAAGLVDELCLTLSPLLVGPGPGRINAGEPLSEPTDMRLVHAITTGDQIFTRYARARTDAGLIHRAGRRL